MRIKISQYEYTGNSYSELLKNICNGEPKMDWNDEKVYDIRMEIQCVIVQDFEDPDDPTGGSIDYDKILTVENWAKEIYDNVFYHHSELKLMEALPRARWFKVVYEDEYHEENSEFYMAVTEKQAINDCIWDLRSNNCDWNECKNFRIVPLTSKDEKELAKQDEISRFLANGCTKAEAIRHIKAGSISVLAAEWNEWAADNDYTDVDGEVITLNQIRNSKADGVGIITAPDGGEYVLLYVL